MGTGRRIVQGAGGRAVGAFQGTEKTSMVTFAGSSRRMSGCFGSLMDWRTAEPALV